MIEVVERPDSSSTPQKLKGVCCGIVEYQGLYQPMDYVYECVECGQQHVCHGREMNILKTKDKVYFGETEQ